MKSEYLALKHVMSLPGWSILEQEWLAQVSIIEEARDKAAKRGSETAWRYYAGQEFGAKLMMTTAMRTIQRMEKEDQELNPDKGYEDLLKEVRGEKA